MEQFNRIEPIRMSWQKWIDLIEKGIEGEEDVKYSSRLADTPLINQGNQEKYRCTREKLEWVVAGSSRYNIQNKKRRREGDN